MPKYLMSYAYDVAWYADFTVEAGSRKEAEAMAKEALNDGRFSNVVGCEFLENNTNHRVFCCGKARGDDSGETMEELILRSDPQPTTTHVTQHLSTH